jgi:xanthine dehydrogenase molybdopterin-binding subunit B
MERAMFHVDNAYFIPNLRVTGYAWKTNKPSNTAFRGFGAPQGMLCIEEAIDRIARFLDMDAAIVRKNNFYGEEINNITHYGEVVENNRLHRMWKELTKSSDYKQKKKAVQEHNAVNTHIKMGIALTPVKFGISFTTKFLNQAGALVNIYSDGSVLINHGGIEMGQGLNTKIRKIAALEFGISEKRIRISPTSTDIVPNTSATAASSGTDMNGMAVKDACVKLISRLRPLLNENETINNSNFNELVQKAWRKRISLSATGFYKTPGIHFDSKKGQGRPFHYFAFGMAVSVIKLDTLTGHVKLLSTDILHDTGDSIHPEVDLGQVRGGFIQGIGWCTTEDMKYSSEGQLLNHSPDTYKIPTAMDIPDSFVVNFLENAPNPKTIRKSKAVGEPPFMLSFSVWLAIKDAISAVADHKKEPDLALPATNEVILHSIQKIKKQ